MNWKIECFYESLRTIIVQGKGQNIYFASDFHLGAPDVNSSLQREKKICQWLDTIKLQAAELYLVGDVFDFWFEYKDVVPRGFTRLFGKLAELSDAGIKITFFKGNHDMWTFQYWQEELNAEVVSDELVIVRNGIKIFMHHGDGLGPGDKKYKFIKKIFRNPICIKLFGFLHPRIGVGLAKFLSSKSRISNGHNDKVYLGEEKEYIPLFCKEKLNTEHFDYFICGHRHYPITMKLNDNSTYINLGEWINDFTYAEFDGTKIELKKFNG